MPAAMLLEEEDELLTVLDDEFTELLELEEDGLGTDEELELDELLEKEEELLDDDAVAFTPTTSMMIIGEVMVCAHWMLNVMDFVTTTFSDPFTGTLLFGPHGLWLPPVSQRCTPVDVQEMFTTLPSGAFTVPSCPLIFTSIVEYPPGVDELLEEEEEGIAEETELLELEEAATGSAQTRVSMNGWRWHAAERTNVLPFQYSMKLSPQLAKFLLRIDCTREYPASWQIFSVVAASSSIATPSWYGLIAFSMKKKCTASQPALPKVRVPAVWASAVSPLVSAESARATGTKAARSAGRKKRR